MHCPFGALTSREGVVAYALGAIGLPIGFALHSRGHISANHCKNHPKVDGSCDLFTSALVSYNYVRGEKFKFIEKMLELLLFSTIFLLKKLWKLSLSLQAISSISGHKIICPPKNFLHEHLHEFLVHGSFGQTGVPEVALLTTIMQSAAPCSKSSTQELVDIGANIGLFTQDLKKVWPNARVHAFEPLKLNINHFSKNTKSLKNVSLNAFAVSDVRWAQ